MSCVHECSKVKQHKASAVHSLCCRVLQVYAILAEPDYSGMFRTYQGIDQYQLVTNRHDERTFFSEQTILGGPNRAMRKKFCVPVMTTHYPKMLAGEFHQTKTGTMRTYQVCSHAAVILHAAFWCSSCACV